MLAQGQESEWDDILYMVWLGEIYGGIRRMEQYNLAAKKWMQAHSCGAFVIMKVLYEAGEGLLTFEEVKKDENDYFIIKLDRYFLLFHSYAFIF